MNNYFYYFGILYLLDILRQLWNEFKAKQDKQNTLIIDDGMDIGELTNVVQKHRSTSKSNTLPHIAGIGFFIWTIVGYISNTPEKYWFLSDAILIIFYNLLLISIGIFFSINAVFGSKAKVSNEQKKNIVNIPLSKIICISEFIIVLMILYQHFL